MNRQETLLPHTRALPAGCVETSRYHGKILIRYRHLDGMSERRQFTEPEEAHTFFQNCCNRLAQEARDTRTIE